MLLLNLVYGMGVTSTDKVYNFGLSSVKQVEESLKSKLFDESVQCFNEVILVNLSY